MTTTRTVWLLTLAMLLWGPFAFAGEHEHHGKATPTDPRFEFLKSLAGTWTGSEATMEFQVTAGGHAVVEREFVGTPMEMVTVYHMAAGQLVATHYCMLGNQPRFTASSDSGDNAVAFDCAGTPGNEASHDAEHVHGWAMKLGADGTLHYSAELVKAGQVSEAPSLVLTRQTTTASR